MLNFCNTPFCLALGDFLSFVPNHSTSRFHGHVYSVTRMHMLCFCSWKLDSPLKAWTMVVICCHSYLFISVFPKTLLSKR